MGRGNRAGKSLAQRRKFHPVVHVNEADPDLKQNLKHMLESREDVRRAAIAQELQPKNDAHLEHLHIVIEFTTPVQLRWAVWFLNPKPTQNPNHKP